MRLFGCIMDRSHHSQAPPGEPGNEANYLILITNRHVYTHLYVLLMFVHCSENLFMNTHILHVFVCLLNLECKRYMVYTMFSPLHRREVCTVSCPTV